MTLSNLLTSTILYVCIPLWMAVGLGDWLFHRMTRISETSGLKESLLHLLMLSEIGIPMLLGLFMEINALVLAIMISGYLAHEATVLWDLRYAINKRPIPPGEQMIHSFQELLPLTMFMLLAFLHWDQFIALVTLSELADFRLQWKQVPLSSSYLAAALTGTAVFVCLPYTEELWRCFRAAARQQGTTGNRTERVMPGQDA